MFISRVVLNVSSLDMRRLGPITQAGAYGEHQAVWRLFGDRADRQRDFLYRREANNWPAYTVVSAREPDDSDGIWNIQTKPYEPKLPAGSVLAFALCANPVLRRKDEAGKTVRHDVVMDAKRQGRLNQSAREKGHSRQEIVQHAGVRWLTARAGQLGFALNDREVVVDGYAQHELRKARAGQSIRFSTLDFRGLLRVSDPDQFIRTLFRGIGPSKAFGCGLMLVRPA